MWIWNRTASETVSNCGRCRKRKMSERSASRTRAAAAQKEPAPWVGCAAHHVNEAPFGLARKQLLAAHVEVREPVRENAALAVPPPRRPAVCTRRTLAHALVSFAHTLVSFETATRGARGALTSSNAASIDGGRGRVDVVLVAGKVVAVHARVSYRASHAHVRRHLHKPLLRFHGMRVGH
eukprot:5682574-Prymnesium_polylepis.1